MALQLSPAGRRYGYHRNPPDHRDKGLGAIRLVQATLPAMSNAKYMGLVLDQGQQGSCTAHAGVADREYLHNKQLAAYTARVWIVSPSGLFSPAFLYYMERKLDGTLDQGDCGSTGRTSCQTLRQYGCATRSEMPYSDTDCSTAPTEIQLQEASQWPTGQYHFAANVDDIKSIIASGYNCRIGFTVYSSFENIGSDGIWTPNTSEDVLGRHQVLAYAYDDSINEGSLLIRNSWGASWGKNGDFYMRYKDAANPDVLMDACIQHLGRWS